MSATGGFGIGVIGIGLLVLFSPGPLKLLGLVALGLG
jgi:hypothetical protein